MSRGGFKLQHALETWSIELRGKACVDIGTSTGGFTDCMLQNGAASVLCVDTGYGQIAHALRVDPRVSLMERTNARNLEPGALPASLTFLAMDVSFISATPRFAGGDFIRFPMPCPIRKRAGSRPDQAAIRSGAGMDRQGRHCARPGRAPVVHRSRSGNVVTALGGVELAVVPSPITGAEGNHEFLLHAIFPAVSAV